MAKVNQKKPKKTGLSTAAMFGALDAASAICDLVRRSTGQPTTAPVEIKIGDITIKGF